VVEIWEKGNDPAATRFTWVIPLAGGEPGIPYEVGGLYTVYEGGDIAPMGSPDNCTFDNDGNLWIATDGRQPLTIDGIPSNDGFFAMPVEGEDRGNLQLFATVPRGAETCGPEFTPDMMSLFLAPQHPDAPWPDGDTAYARPGVVSIWKSGRGDPRIGK
jgi:secreted PhoX family phosphatase